MSRTGRLTLASLMLLTLTMPLSSGRALTEDPHSPGEMAAQKPRPQGITVMLFYPGDECSGPARVKSESSYPQTREDFFTNATVESNSEKPIKALKLGWNVYDYQVKTKELLSGCGPRPAAEVLLSGETPLIELPNSMQKGETCYIGLYPQIAGYPATFPVAIHAPIIATSQLKPLMEDEASLTFKGKYFAAIYVSEVRFDDGTKWEGGIK